ncbi:MAG: aspartate aminotransferase family protein [Bacteroidetes bacterium]|nr:MAG: aspartate aminotransferase family protein [Bacteroidota bacterium]
MPTLRQLFLQHLAQTSDIPLALEIDRAEGLYLYDPSGKAYLDLISGIAVSALGHRHPAVLQAAREQMDRYLHTLVYGEFVLAPQVRLAEALCAALGPGFDSVYFVNSGSEAVEGAMKLAKRFTGGPHIVACREAYHGSTQGAASLMEPTTFTRAYHPLLPGIRHIRFNHSEDLETIDADCAAVIIEPVQAEAGVRPPDPAFFQALRRRCTETGALLVFDEIQTGYGRTGSLWAFQQLGVVPDVILLAKAMGGGFPIGAFATRREIMHCLSQDPPLGHITTFGGHPVSCAAALATLRTLQSGPWIAAVKDKEALFRQRLRHPAIRELRSAGLLLALELESFERVRKVQLACLEKGLLTDWFLFNERSLRIAPPLLIEEEQIEWACQTLLQTLEEV